MRRPRSIVRWSCGIPFLFRSAEPWFTSRGKKRIRSRASIASCPFFVVLGRGQRAYSGYRGQSQHRHYRVTRTVGVIARSPVWVLSASNCARMLKMRLVFAERLSGTQ